MKKILREIRRSIMQEFPGCSVHIEMGGVHYRAVVVWQGKRRMQPVPCTPRSFDDTIKSTIANLHRLFREPTRGELIPWGGRRADEVLNPEERYTS